MCPSFPQVDYIDSYSSSYFQIFFYSVSNGYTLKRKWFLKAEIKIIYLWFRRVFIYFLYKIIILLRKYGIFLIKDGNKYKFPLKKIIISY